MSAAMAMVKQSLGEDAIIVSTREDKKNRVVRVTAAIEAMARDEMDPAFDEAYDFAPKLADDDDDAFGLIDENILYDSEDTNFDISENDAGDSADDSYDDWQPEDRELRRFNHLDDDFEEETDGFFAIRDDHLAADLNDKEDYFDFDLEQDEDGLNIEADIAEPIIESLLRHNLTAAVTDRIVAEALALGEHAETPRAALMQAIDSLYKFEYLPDEAMAKPIMLIGPPGSGKTMTAAKLAARAVMNDLNTVVITTDTLRAGGIEQLSAFTRLLNIDLQEAPDAKSLKDVLLRHLDADQIIIDTSGINPFNPEEVKELAQLIRAVDVEPVLVLPAGGDASESADIARAFAVLGAKKLLPTRMDIARRIGGILSAAMVAKLSFCEASNTAQVADGLIRLSSYDFGKILIPDSHNKKTDI